MVVGSYQQNTIRDDMCETEMKSYRNDDLIRLLADGQADLRMLVLHLLCEGYATDPTIFSAVLQGWDELGAESAFPEFPMLSYFPLPETAVAACCGRASSMVSGGKLTNPVTRCAGKLVEQMMTLPPGALEPHLSLIEATVRKSKIFFRVDLEGLRERIQFLDKSADELAGTLNEAIATLCSQPDARPAIQRGLRALEALRIRHPDYLDLAHVLRASPPSAGSNAASFQLVLQSLIQFEQAGLASHLGKHLGDGRESIYPNVVEALVRLGNPEAADAFVNNFPNCPDANQRWIARGLQRIRIEGLADQVAELRSSVADPALWLMLLIAEVRQFDARCSDRIGSELSRLNSYSETLIDSLSVYARLNEESEGARAFQMAFMDYIQRSNEALTKRISEQSAQSSEMDTTSSRLWQQNVLRYRKSN